MSVDKTAHTTVKEDVAGEEDNSLTPGGLTPGPSPRGEGSV